MTSSPSSTLRAWSRRDFLRNTLWAAGAAGTAGLLAGCGTSVMPAASRISAGASRFADIGPLGEPDLNGLRLPAGFSSRVVAVSGLPVLPSAYVWHIFPDGGATYAMPDGGWVYTSNSELPQGGGCGAIRFNAQGEVVDAYPILTETRGNCAGGKMPWGTWMSCEEVNDGIVYECEVTGPGQGIPHEVFGRYNREAIVVDAANKVFYLTEDAGSGRFYRYVPYATDWPAGAERPTLAPGQGVLQCARFAALAPNQSPPEGFDLTQPQPIVWEDVVSPELPQSEVRGTLGDAAPGTPFRGGEGLWFFNGFVYFSTKSDNRIWVLDVAAQTIESIYHFDTAPPEDQILTGVDNLTVTEFGDVLVAEDGGDMHICVILPDRRVIPLLQATDLQQGSPAESELTGPAFSPDGTRLYFSAQRNGRNGSIGPGITFEVTLPFSACPSGACPS